MRDYSITVLHDGKITHLSYNKIEEKGNMDLYLLDNNVILAIEVVRAEPTASPE